MPLKGVKCIRGYVDMPDHQRCMLEQPGPPCGITPTILQLMTRPNVERERERVVFSPSSFSTCHRRDTLTARHDWFLDVKQGYKTVRGTLIHQGVGQEPPQPGVLGVVRELRMAAPIIAHGEEHVFHGKPDEVVLLRVEAIPTLNPPVMEPVTHYETFHMRHRLYVKVVDFKTRSEVGHDLTTADRKHVIQVNMYGWLVSQFLPGYLRGFGEFSVSDRDDEADADYYSDHLLLSKDWPIGLTNIDEVVVDELSIAYMDMRRTRTFTSKGFLYDQGKMLSDYKNGHWIRRNPAEYEELELDPIHQFRPEYTESLIRKGIEEQIEAETLLAPPLVGEDVKIMCTSCPVRQQCYDLGREEGYGMEEQRPYVTG